MRWVLLALLAAGCTSPNSDLQMCQPDESACVEDSQCCGDAYLDPTWGIKFENVKGRCWTGACCTQYETDGWICLLCGAKSICFPPPRQS